MNTDLNQHLALFGCKKRAKKGERTLLGGKRVGHSRAFCGPFLSLIFYLPYS